MRLLLGFIVGIVLAVGAGYGYLRRDDACLGRCGAGTHCDAARCIPSGPAVAQAPPKPAPTRKRRGGGGGGGGTGIGPAPAPLQPGDTVMASEGERTGKTEKLNLAEGGSERELSAADIDATLASAEPRATRCITDAVGDAPLDTAKVKMHLRVEASGAVSRVAVDAPRLLLRNGLYKCMRGVAQSMHFPASGGASVVEAPYELK